VITITLEEREVRALASACGFTRTAFQQAELSLPPEEDKLASGHLKLISALEQQEEPSGFEALGVREEPNPHVRRTWSPR